jgi:hypothetical protein
VVELLRQQVAEELMTVSAEGFLKKQGEAVALQKLLRMMSTQTVMPNTKT